MTAFCPQCKRAFEPAHHHHRFCSSWCAAAATDEAKLRSHLDAMVAENGSRRIKEPTLSDQEAARAP